MPVVLSCSSRNYTKTGISAFACYGVTIDSSLYMYMFCFSPSQKSHLVNSTHEVCIFYQAFHHTFRFRLAHYAGIKIKPFTLHTRLPPHDSAGSR
jgi:hypothetical protein